MMSQALDKETRSVETAPSLAAAVDSSLSIVPATSTSEPAAKDNSVAIAVGVACGVVVALLVSAAVAILVFRKLQQQRTPPARTVDEAPSKPQYDRVPDAKPRYSSLSLSPSPAVAPPEEQLYTVGGFES